MIKPTVLSLFEDSMDNSHLWKNIYNITLPWLALNNEGSMGGLYF